MEIAWNGQRIVYILKERDISELTDRATKFTQRDMQRERGQSRDGLGRVKALATKLDEFDNQDSHDRGLHSYCTQLSFDLASILQCAHVHARARTYTPKSKEKSKTNKYSCKNHIL